MRHIKGLKIDWECGEGDLELPEKFRQESHLFQADVLRDWLGMIEAEYNLALERMHQEWAERQLWTHQKQDDLN